MTWRPPKFGRRRRDEDADASAYEPWSPPGVTSIPKQNPLTRILQVALGLSALADGLQKETGVDPVNIRYWSRELREIYDEIEKRYQTKPPASSEDRRD